MNNFEHYLPAKIIFGKGQIKQLGVEAAKYGKKILLVYGGGSIKRTGVYDQVMEQLKGFQVFELPGVEPNPRVSTCRIGVNICKKEGIDLILAVGGGSTMDSAKCIAAGVKYDGDPWDLVVDASKIKEALPLACVVTLAATGSQYNHIAVISNTDTTQKVAQINMNLVPKFSICDPEYTFSVPTDQTAFGSADMMVHAMDQYFSKVTDTPLQDRFAESIIKTIIENAPIAMKEPADYAARANLLWCDCWAMSQTCMRGKQGDSSTHMLEHELSAYYDITHGLGIAIVWPNWARSVYKINIPKFAQFAKRVWEIDPAGKTDEELALAGIQKTDDFFRSLGIPKTLREVGITCDEHMQAMVDDMVVLKKIPGGWDKQLDAAAYKKILQNCL
ncbi:MAG: iron-containing alcohol dehydrogenase [Christensenellales bacterium]